MKFAEYFFEELLDTLNYTAKSWLNTEISQHCMDNCVSIIGASAFNFDHIFCKEKAGLEISKLVFDNSYNFKKDVLSNNATSLRLLMTGKEYDQGRSEFGNYFLWISKQETPLMYAYKDKAGQLILATIDLIVSEICEDKKDTIPAFRIAELYFLSLVNTFTLLYKEFFKDKYKELDSFLFLEEIENASQSIRAQIAD